MPRLLHTLALASLASSAAAQVSELYLTAHGSTETFVVQNGQIVRQFQRTSTVDGPALVVGQTVKLYGQVAGAVGREYDLNGGLLAGAYVNAGFVDCYDGATDGARNWTISHNDFSNNFAALVAGANWGSAQVAFVPARRSSGITYDPTDDTLWVTNNVGGSDRVQHYATGGALLGEFPVGLQSGGGYGLALDYADQTLWIPGAFGTVGQLHQYSKAGALLQLVHVPGLAVNVVGAEFRFGAPPPLPPTYCTPGTTSNGCNANIAASAHPNVSHSSACQISVSGVEGQKSGIVFYSLAQLIQPWCPPGSGSSLLCVKTPTFRTSAQSSGGAAGACNGQLQLDWSAFQLAHPGAMGNPWSPGAKAYVQAWFRDPASCRATSLSNAVELTYLP